MTIVLKPWTWRRTSRRWQPLNLPSLRFLIDRGPLDSISKTPHVTASNQRSTLLPPHGVEQSHTVGHHVHGLGYAFFLPKLVHGDAAAIVATVIVDVDEPSRHHLSIAAVQSQALRGDEGAGGSGLRPDGAHDYPPATMCSPCHKELPKYPT